MSLPPRRPSVAPALFALAVAGWVLIMPPLLPVAGASVLGLPVTALYLLLVWVGLLAAVRWLFRRERDGPR
jgi:hypothetical protein